MDSLRSSTTRLVDLSTKLTAGGIGGGRRVVRDVPKESKTIVREFMSRNEGPKQFFCVQEEWEMFDQEAYLVSCRQLLEVCQP